MFTPTDARLGHACASTSMIAAAQSPARSARPLARRAAGQRPTLARPRRTWLRRPPNSHTLKEKHMSTTITEALDEAALDDFVHRFVTDLAATHHAVTVAIGDRLGLYRAVAEAGPATEREIAAAADCDERYTHEWLNAQAASGYCEYDPQTGRYHLTPAQRACLADEKSPTFLTAGVFLAAALFKDEEKLAEVIRTGAGFGWGEHHHDLYFGVERFFRPGYAANLVASWIPALDGVQGKLTEGVTVADVGCGRGASTILLAQAYPELDLRRLRHPRTVDRRRPRCGRKRRRWRPRAFRGRIGPGLPRHRYALVCIFDALHDMGDPVGAAGTSARRWQTTARGCSSSRWPAIPFPRISTRSGGCSTRRRRLVCTPSARSQSGGWALGAQATDEQLRSITEQGGFSRFRRAVDTPVNRIIEVRP